MKRIAAADSMMRTGSKAGIVVWGAGGHAKVVLDILTLSECKILGFVDDTAARKRSRHFCGFPLYGNVKEVPVSEGRHIFIAIGNNEARQQKSASAEEQGFQLVSIVHPRAIIARDVQVGPGTLVAAGAVINPGAVIGKNVIVNTLACIEHDCTIENGVHVAPGARLAGHVRVGSGAWIGIGATIIDKITIGKHSIIGAGSVVIRNIPADVVVAGVPARMIRTVPSN